MNPLAIALVYFAFLAPPVPRQNPAGRKWLICRL